MAKRKKKSKVQKRAKPRRGNSAARKAVQAKRAAKAKRAPAKKAARKVKQLAAPAVEGVAVEVIEQSAPGVITVTEVEETEIRKAS
jgi:hypothetical protein